MSAQARPILQNPTPRSISSTNIHTLQSSRTCIRAFHEGFHLSPRPHFHWRAPVLGSSHCFRFRISFGAFRSPLSVRTFARSMSPHAQSLKLDGEHRTLQQCEMSEVVECPQQLVATGSIHLILGPMFAGKTTALLKRVQAEACAGRNVAMVKSDKDTRYGLAAVVSHDGMQMPCWAVPSLTSFRDHIGEEAYAKLDVIGIDEAQFLQDLYSFCQVAADHEGKTLIVAGLDGDFLRNRFGSILELVPLADSVVKLCSYCELCGKPAFFTFRKIDESKKELIGGTDVYMPVCRRHYFSGQVAMETARKVLEA